MAISKDNVITRGLRGKIGELVFRQYGDKTVVSAAPQMPSEASGLQKASRKRFQQAVIYAKSAMTDPDMKAAYEDAAEKRRTAYNVAVADFLHAPDIETIDLSEYTGKAGDPIRIRVSDDFLVKDVKLTIVDHNGNRIEDGDAMPDALGVVWTYTADKNVDNFEVGKIVVTAVDFPGNKAVCEDDL